MTYAPPTLFSVASDMKFLVVESDRGSMSRIDAGWSESGLTERSVRGKKMRTYDRLLDEFAAAMQFPWYFGENSAAFDECIADLEWLPPGQGYVIVILNADLVLADSPDPDDLRWLVDALARAQGEWAVPVESGEWWDRPAIPFHVVLHWTPDAAAVGRARWIDAGAHLAPLPIEADDEAT